jgi:hypothetical protein
MYLVGAVTRGPYESKTSQDERSTLCNFKKLLGVEKFWFWKETFKLTAVM